MRTPPVPSLRPLSFSLARLTSSFAIAAAISLAGASTARAATLRWDPNHSLTNPPSNGSGSWSTGVANWFNGAADVVWNNAAGDIAQFNGIGGLAPFLVTLDTNITASSLIFNSNGYTISGAGTTLTLTLGNVTVDPGVTAVLAATVGGTNGLTLSGGGTLELAQANTFTGLTTVNANSVLRVDDAASTGAVVLNSGTLEFGNGITYNQNIALNDGATLLGGTTARSNGTLTVAGAATVNLNTATGQTFTIGNGANAITGGDGTGTIQVGGATDGILLLNNSNNVSANWVINAGTVQANDRGAFGTGSIQVNAGTNLLFNQAGNGDQNNPIILNGGTLTQFVAAQLTLQRVLTVDAASTIDIPQTNPGKIFVNAGITGTGGLTKNGNGILQIVQPNPSYTGNWILNGGQIEAQNDLALGTGSVTVNGGELVASPTKLLNPVTIGAPGAILGFDNGNTGDFLGAITASNDFNVGLRDFYNLGVARNGAISGAISGPGKLTVLTPPSPATLTIQGNNAAWTGGIDAPANVQIRVIEGGQHGLGTGVVNAPGGLFMTLTPDLPATLANAGFSARYYVSQFLIGTGVAGGFDPGFFSPIATRSEDVIDLLDTPNGGTIPNPPVPGLPQDHNLELWTGVLNVAAGGSYTFSTASDDGSLLYLDGQQLVQNDFAQGLTERFGSVSLTPGLHSLIVKFGQGTGGGGMHAYYQGPDTSDSKILIGSIPDTVTNNGSAILGTTIITRDIPLGTAGNNGFDLAAVNATVQSALVFQPGISLSVTGVTGNELLTQTGPVTLNGSNQFTLGIIQIPNGASGASAGADMLIVGNIGEAVPGSELVKAGPRTLTLSGTNTYTGLTTVNNGALQLDSPVANAGVSAAGLLINATSGDSVARLLRDEQLPDVLTLSITNSGTRSALFDINGFTETISGLNITGLGANSAGVLTGGLGTLNLLGDIVLNANRPAANNTGREILISSFGDYNFSAPGGTLNLGGARNITVETTNTGVNIPGSDATIETNIVNGTITKLGSRTLILGGSNTYSGGTIIKAGAVRATGPNGTTSTALGTGAVTLNGGTLELRNNGIGNNGTITYGNDLIIDPSQTTVSFDVRNNGANTGNTLLLGTAVLGTQTLTVTGANDYSVGFNNVTLIGNPIVNPKSANLTLNNVSESGGSRTLTKPGTSEGVLILGGNGTYTGGTNLPTGSGPLRLIASVGSTNKPAGSGIVTLGSGTTLQFSPTVTTISGAGAVAGALTAKFYNGGQTINNSEVFELPTAVTSVSILADGTFFNRPSVITPNSGTNMLAVYSGLLNITTGGTYNFQSSGGDASQLVIDGVPVTTVNPAGTNPQAFSDGAVVPVTLSAGFHTITMKAFNAGSGGGLRVRYQGADTANVLQVIPGSKLFSAPPSLNVANIGAPVSIAAGSVTIDSRGSEVDSGVSALTLGAGVALNLLNAGGSGAFNVSGTTTLQGIATFNLASSLLNLSGDLADGGGNFAITKNGAGALILSGAKTFGGTLTINAGGVQVTNPASLGGTGNGTIVTNAVTPLSSTTTLAQSVVTVPSTAGLVVGAFVSGTGIPLGATIASITGPNTFTLSVNATVTATNTLNYTFGGTLDLNGVALNAEPLTLSGGGSVSTPAALYNSSAAAASASGPITIGSPGTKIGGFGDITLSGTLSGDAANDLTKIGADTLTLNGSGAGTFLGALTISQGVVKLGNDNALGATGATANTIVSTGATLDLNGRTIGESITLSGAGLVNLGGANTLGALINTNASLATVSGPITLAAAGSIGSPLAGGGNITLNGAIGGAFALTKVGSNTVTLGAVNGYTGAGTVQLGTLILNGAGSIATETSMSVNPSATLVLDDTGTNNTAGSRLGTTAKRLNLIGGNLNLLGNSAANTVEDLGSGQMFIDSQNTIVTLTPGAGRNLLFNATGTGVAANTSGLVRNGASSKGTVLFRGTNLGVNAIGTAGDASITLGGLIPTVGQPGAAGTKNRAIIPWALVDTSAGGSGSSFAAYSATNGLQGLQPGEFDTTIVANNNIVASSAISAPGTTTINSLTLKAGGGLTIASGRSVSLDSGGILATANASITGPGTITSTLVVANNRELLVFATGAANKLTISAPISVNGGLTKAGDGTLTFTGQQPIGGAIRLNAGKTELAAGVNTIAYAVTAPPTVGNTASAPTNNTIQLNNGATLDLLGNDQRFGGFASNATAGTNLPGTSGTITNSSGTTATLRIGMKNSVTSLPTAITGNLNFQRDGISPLTVTSPWTYTGSTMLNGGVLAFVDAGGLPNTSSLAIHRASLKIDDSGIQATSHINAAAPITLDGGGISFTSRSNTADVLDLGATSLNSGASVIVQSLGGAAANTNTGTSTVNIASLTRSQGATINFGVTANGNVSLGANPRVLLGTGTPTLTGGLVGGWATTVGYNSANIASGGSGVDFATYDPVTGFGPTKYSAEYASGNNVNTELKDAGAASSTLPAGDNAINSLRIGTLGSTTSNTLNFTSPTDLLNLESGGLLSTGSNTSAVRTIGGTQNEGLLTAGGSASTGVSELFIHNSTGTLTINSNIVNNPNGAQVALVLGAVSGNSTIQLAGSNTYTGTTYVNGVITTLNSAGLAIPGNLIISGGTQNAGDSQTTAAQTVRLLAANQIAATADVTINGGSQLDLNGLNNTIKNLTFAADGGSNGNIGPSLLTGAGQLTVTGNISATNLLSATTIPVMNGKLALPAGNHTIAIGTFPGAPGQVGLQINSAVTGPGNVNLASGVLGLGSTADIGGLSGAGTVLGTTAGATLTVGNGGANGNFTGVLAGPLTFVKVGAGTQSIASTLGRPTVTNSAGTLQLSAGAALTALNLGDTTLTSVTAHAGGPANVKTLDTLALTLTGSAKLDLSNNAMIVRGGDYATLYAKTVSGFNGSAWDGVGINSSAAATEPDGRTVIAIANNADLGFSEFAGVTGLTGNEILFKYTYYGDANLDGNVGAEDFSAFLQGFTGAEPASWLTGDFNYDGAVGAEDFSAFLGNFSTVLPQLRDPVLMEQMDSFAQQLAANGSDAGGTLAAGIGSDLSGQPGSVTASQAVVPEPGSIGLLAVGALGLLSRRRRRL
jgi:autotransporter-associated beta strand protein